MCRGWQYRGFGTPIVHNPVWGTLDDSQAVNMHRLGYHKTMVVRLAAASLLVIMLLLMLGSMQEDALTYDEPAHIVAGYSYLHWQNARLNPAHLPLLKMLAVAPLLPLNLQLPPGLLPFKYLVADCLYGNSPDFLEAVNACVGVTALVAVPSETRCCLQCPPLRTRLIRIRETYARNEWWHQATPRVPWRLWRRASRLALLSAESLGRDQGTHRICVCPPTRDAV
jgi:hypothetical protein